MFNQKANEIYKLRRDLSFAEADIQDYKRNSLNYDLNPRQKWLAHHALDYVCGWLQAAAAETAVKDGSGVAAVNELTSLAAECSKATEPLRRALGEVLADDNPFVKHLDS